MFMVLIDPQLDENQKKIILLLADGPRTWKELLNLTGFARGTLAKHLKRLLDKGLITERIDKKDRRIKIYELNFNPDVVTTLAVDFLALDLNLRRFLPYIIYPPETEEELSAFLKEFGNAMIVGAIVGGEAYRVSLKILEMMNAVAEKCADSDLKQHMKERWEEIWRKWVGIVSESLKNQKTIPRGVEEGQYKDALECIEPALKKVTPIPLEIFLRKD